MESQNSSLKPQQFPFAGLTLMGLMRPLGCLQCLVWLVQYLILKKRRKSSDMIKLFVREMVEQLKNVEGTVTV